MKIKLNLCNVKFLFTDAQRYQGKKNSKGLDFLQPHGMSSQIIAVWEIKEKATTSEEGSEHFGTFKGTPMTSHLNPKYVTTKRPFDAFLEANANKRNP